MRDLCPHCGHSLRSEVRSKRAFRFVVYFDNDKRSATYAARVRSCPECGADLLGNALDPQELTPP
jgi:rRNA maturation protein Nop10